MIGTLGDLLYLLSPDKPIKPKKIIMDLSEDGTFYYTKLYIDVIDRSKNQEYEACIECRSNKLEFDLIYDLKNRDEKIFTLTIPEIEA
jgi:hypothetical protein